MINSHLLYQLSYRGMRRMLLIEKEKSSIDWQARGLITRPARQRLFCGQVQPGAGGRW